MSTINHPLFIVHRTKGGNIEVIITEEMVAKSDVAAGIIVGDLLRNLQLASGVDLRKVLRIVHREIKNPTSPILSSHGGS